MSRPGRWFRRGLFAVVLLLVVGAGAYVWIGAVAGPRLESEMKALEEEKEPTRLSELAPPPVPEAENAAVVLRRAAALLVDGEDMLDQEGAEDVWAVDDALMRLEESTSTDPDADRALLARWVERNREALALLDEALERPRCRFDLDYDSALEMEMPQVRWFQQLNRLLLARILLEAHAGETEASLESVRTHLRLARLLEGEPTLIFTLIQFSLEHSAIRRLPRILGDGEVPETGVRALLAEIGRRDPRARLRLAMRGERCFGIAAFALLKEEPDKFGLMTGLDDEAGGGWWWRVVPRPIFELDEAWYLRLMRQVAALAGKPYHESVADRDALDHETENPPWYAVVSRLAIPMLGNVLRRGEEHVARLDQARLVLALEVHVARHGGLPETLDALDDDLIPTAPVDPFTGEPYVYERVGETGFALRSVGPDGEDDRGADDDVPWSTAD